MATKELLKQLKSLSPQEIEKVLMSLAEDEEKATVLAKAVGKIIGKKAQMVKAQTELAIAQSNYFILERDLEEIAILPEVVEHLNLDQDAEKITLFSQKPEGEFWEKLQKENNLSDGELIELFKAVKGILSKFSYSEALSWVVKMLRNYAVGVTGDFEDAPSENNKAKNHQKEKTKSDTVNIIVLSLPQTETEINESHREITKEYFIEIPPKKRGKGRKKQVEGIPIFALTHTTRIIDGKIEEEIELRNIWNGKTVKLSNKNLKELNALYTAGGDLLDFSKSEKTIEKYGYQIGEFTRIAEEIYQRIIDKYAFFVYAIPSSKLNKSLREYLSRKGFITMRKNQSIYIANDENKEKVFYYQLGEVRLITKILKECYNNTLSYIKENADELYLPSIKNMPLSKYILLEEMAILSREEIERALVGKFQEYLNKLRKLMEEDVPLDVIENYPWFTEMELLYEKLNSKLPLGLKEDFKNLHILAERKMMEKSFITAFNSFNKKPTLENLDKVLSVFDKEIIGEYTISLAGAVNEYLAKEAEKGNITHIAYLIKKRQDTLVGIFKDAIEQGEQLNGLVKALRELKHKYPEAVKELAQRLDINIDEDIKKKYRFSFKRL